MNKEQIEYSSDILNTMKTYYIPVVSTDIMSGDDNVIEIVQAESAEQAFEIIEKQTVEAMGIPECETMEDCGYEILGAFETEAAAQEAYKEASGDEYDLEVQENCGQLE